MLDNLTKSRYKSLCYLDNEIQTLDIKPLKKKGIKFNRLRIIEEKFLKFFESLEFYESFVSFLKISISSNIWVMAFTAWIKDKSLNFK
jgi:hypothetical protein